MKIFKTISSILLVSLLISGCSYSEAEIRNESEYIENKDMDNLIEVGFSQLGSESRWRVAHTKSIQEALTTSNGFLLDFSNARQKQENQIKAIRGFIAEGVDYIAFSPVTEDGWDTVLMEAKEAKIPVILIDRKIDKKNEDLYSTWVGTDARLEGENAGRWLEDFLLEKGRGNSEINIVVLQGTIGSSAQLGRTIGFDSIADTHRNWHILEQTSADFTTAKGKEVMEQFLEKYEKIDVVVSQNDDMTFGALDAMNEVGIKTGEDGDIILISFDAVRKGLELVEKGIINVDIECNPVQGEFVADIIKRMDAGEVVDKQNIVTEKIFTKDNVSEYLDSRAY